MKLSIVTVCYNAEKTIKGCIESVLALEERDYEYLIIDGKSMDQTIAIARSYQESFIKKKIPYRILSEPDSGTYDAMNKAIDKAAGEWIIFMNSDDRFHDAMCIRKFMQMDVEKFGVVYGDTICIKDGKEVYTLPRPVEVLREKRVIPFIHQSSITRKDLLKKYRFDQKYRILADTEMFIRMYDQGESFQYLPGCIAHYATTGISSTDKLGSLREKKMILKEHNSYTLRRRIGLNCLAIWYRVKSCLPDNVRKHIHHITDRIYEDYRRKERTVSRSAKSNTHSN